MQKLITCLMVPVGIIHVLPAVGMISRKKLNTLYGIQLETADKSLLVLLKHRAAMFGILGGFIIYASFHEQLVWLGILIGLLSAVSFMVFMKVQGVTSPEMKNVYFFDAIAVILLLVASVLYVLQMAR